jgi:hypothetical protein
MYHLKHTPKKPIKAGISDLPGSAEDERLFSRWKIGNL